MRKLWTSAGSVCAAATMFAAQAPSPLSPEAERSTFQFADSNIVAELVAAEPNVRAPVAMAWDEQGRMFVAEMTDYPAGPVSGRIRMLEDRDGDGVYERATLFATNLAFPNGVMPWNKGLLVTAAPDIWYLADTNGDGHSDRREKVLTGFAEGNQQLRVNGLYLGIDNWIYGCNGRSDGEVRWGDGTAAGAIRRRDFRFRPGTHEFEAVAGNSQFGMGHDDWGNRFPVFNNVPIRHVVVEDRYVERQPLLAGTEVVPGISPTNGGNRVFAVTPPALLIPQPVGFFTSACGPSVYRGNALAESYRGNYFVCEPVQNLVQRRVLVPEGATFRADYASTNREFQASTDPWFHGVFTATGPDGALYVVDMYREWVEHPHWVAAELRERVDWRKGEEHGRIWRLRDRHAKARPVPRLANAGSAELVEALKSENGWARDTAQRLLLERNAQDTARALAALVDGSSAPAAIHALHLLSSFGALKPAVVRAALRHVNPRVREHGVECAELLLKTVKGKDASVAALVTEVAALASDTDARVRMKAILALGPGSDGQSLAALAAFAKSQALDDWQILALLSSTGDRPWLLLQQVFGSGTFPSGSQLSLVTRFASAIAAGGNDADRVALLNWLVAWHAKERIAPLAVCVEAPRCEPALQRMPAGGRATVVADANAILANRSEGTPLRSAAIRVVARMARDSSRSVLEGLLAREEAEAIQAAAVRALLDWNDDAITKSLFDRWGTMSKVVQQQMLASAVRSKATAGALLGALEAGKVPLVQVDAVTRQGIERIKDPAITSRATKLFAQAIAADRDEVVQRYRGALAKTGERKHGAEVFEKNCTTCHQMQGVGAKIGPDLSGIGTQTRESLLVQILDPSRQVLPDYVAYIAETKTGDSYTGFIAGETGTTITLRRANEPDITLQRSDLQELRTSGKSLMPDGLEAAISEQDMSDLIEFLRRPDRTLFSASATLERK